MLYEYNQDVVSRYSILSYLRHCLHYNALMCSIAKDNFEIHPNDLLFAGLKKGYSLSVCHTGSSWLNANPMYRKYIINNNNSKYLCHIVPSYFYYDDNHLIRNVLHYYYWMHNPRSSFEGIMDFTMFGDALKKIASRDYILDVLSYVPVPARDDYSSNKAINKHLQDIGIYMDDDNISIECVKHNGYYFPTAAHLDIVLAGDQNIRIVRDLPSIINAESDEPIIPSSDSEIMKAADNGVAYIFPPYKRVG